MSQGGAPPRRGGTRGGGGAWGGDAAAPSSGRKPRGGGGGRGMGRVRGRRVVGQEAQVVVAVRGLCRAARVDHVDLRGDLVAGAEPGRRGQRQDVVGVVVGERLGVEQGRLLQRVPHPVVGTGLR